MSEFKKYTKNKLYKVVDGVTIIIPCESSQIIPINCPVCGVLYRSKRDEESHNKFDCCDRCALEHIPTITINRWMLGIRPDKEVIEKTVSARPDIMTEFDLDL
jgi:endogenous inhibitor of DNA gyrase (YacG/DUF329 family)